MSSYINKPFRLGQFRGSGSIGQALSAPSNWPSRNILSDNRNFSSCMSLLLAIHCLSTLLMASVVNFALPAALAAVSDNPCLQSMPTTWFQTYSSSTVGAYHEQDDQQEQRQYAHRHHPGSDNGDTAINERTPQHITVCHWRRYYCTQCTMRMRNRYSTVGTSKCPLQINYWIQNLIFFIKNSAMAVQTSKTKPNKISCQ